MAKIFRACTFGPSPPGCVIAGCRRIFHELALADEPETLMGAFTRHSVEFDSFELGNRYVRGIGGRPLLTRLLASLPTSV